MCSKCLLYSTCITVNQSHGPYLHSPDLCLTHCITIHAAHHIYNMYICSSILCQAADDCSVMTSPETWTLQTATLALAGAVCTHKEKLLFSPDCFVAGGCQPPMVPISCSVIPSCCCLWSPPESSAYGDDMMQVALPSADLFRLYTMYGMRCTPKLEDGNVQVQLLTLMYT